MNLSVCLRKNSCTCRVCLPVSKSILASLDKSDADLLLARWLKSVIQLRGGGHRQTIVCEICETWCGCKCTPLIQLQSTLHLLNLAIKSIFKLCCQLCIKIRRAFIYYYKEKRTILLPLSNSTRWCNVKYKRTRMMNPKLQRKMSWHLYFTPHPQNMKSCDQSVQQMELAWCCTRINLNFDIF